MKKYILAILFILCTAQLFSVEVDIDEISKSRKIDFINYSGQDRGKYETVSQIKSIGHRLSYIAKRGESGRRVRFNMKYSVIRAIDTNDKEKLSADIFYIDRTARVDHIKNIRRIISSYLEGMYGYTEREADAVALYTTYYNAIYRGNLDYFGSRYAGVVMKNINRTNAGLSTNYRDWPGKTAIIIPLTEQNMRGEIGGIDPFVISDEKVKKEIRKDGENDGDRKELITLKEKEIDRNKKDIKEEKKKIDENKKENEDKKKKIEERKTENEKRKEEIKKEKEETSKIADPEERKKKEDEIKKREDEVKKEEKEITEEEKKIRKEDENIKKENETIEKKEKEIVKKEEEVRKEKTGTEETGKSDTPEKGKENTSEKEKELEKKEEVLKEKEKELDKREDTLKDKAREEGVFGLKIYYLEVKDYLEGGHYNNTMYMINATTKKIEFKSPVENICGRRYDVYSGGIAVITHVGSHRAGHRLTLIDRETLKEIRTGEENIFWRSFVEIRDGHIYAIIKDGDTENYYLGKFDSNLKLVAKSSEKIYLNTFITFFDRFIYINKHDRSIMVLNVDDLKMTDTIRP